MGIMCSLIIASIFLGFASWAEGRNIAQRTGWFYHFWFLFRVMIHRKMTHQL